ARPKPDARADAVQTAVFDRVAAGRNTGRAPRASALDRPFRASRLLFLSALCAPHHRAQHSRARISGLSRTLGAHRGARGLHAREGTIDPQAPAATAVRAADLSVAGRCTTALPGPGGRASSSRRDTGGANR